MKVAVVAEFYPSRRDPVLGVWAHRQALAARDAGAEVRVLVLHRLVPPRASFADGPRGAADAAGKARARASHADPRRPRGLLRPLRLAAARRLLRELGSLGRAGPRAGAAPAAPLVRIRPDPRPQRRAGRRRRARAATRLDVPLVVSVHGGDVLYTAADPPPAARGRRGGGARAGRRAPGARQQPRDRRARRAPTAPARRASCTSAPTYPAPAFVTTHGIARARRGR